MQLLQSKEVPAEDFFNGKVKFETITYRLYKIDNQNYRFTRTNSNGTEEINYKDRETAEYWFNFVTSPKGGQ